MRIPAWRLALTGGAITILALAGVGLVLAGSPAAIDTASAERPGRGPVGDDLGRFGRPALGHRLAAAGRHLVHAEITVLDRDGNLVTHQLDRGTVRSIGGASLTIEEAGGTVVAVATDEATVVRLGRALGELADLEVGDDVIVHSRIEDGAPVARHVVRLPDWVDADPG
jgi:hypothetical protein